MIIFVLKCLGYENCSCRNRICVVSIATLLSQHNHVVAVDVIPEKVEKINSRKGPLSSARLS